VAPWWCASFTANSVAHRCPMWTGGRWGGSSVSGVDLGWFGACTDMHLLRYGQRRSARRQDASGRPPRPALRQGGDGAPGVWRPARNRPSPTCTRPDSSRLSPILEPPAWRCLCVRLQQRRHAHTAHGPKWTDRLRPLRVCRRAAAGWLAASEPQAFVRNASRRCPRPDRPSPTRGVARQWTSADVPPRW